MCSLRAGGEESCQCRNKYQGDNSFPALSLSQASSCRLPVSGHLDLLLLPDDSRLQQDSHAQQKVRIKILWITSSWQATLLDCQEDKSSGYHSDLALCSRKREDS